MWCHNSFSNHIKLAWISFLDILYEEFKAHLATQKNPLQIWMSVDKKKLDDFHPVKKFNFSVNFE